MPVREAIHRYLTALRPVYVPLRSKSGTCPATRRLLSGYGAKRHPDGQRDDGLTCNGRLTARRERIFFAFPYKDFKKSARFARQKLTTSDCSFEVISDFHFSSESIFWFYFKKLQYFLETFLKSRILRIPNSKLILRNVKTLTEGI